MIPLATKTTLSYEKCAKLQQKLADLKQSNPNALPNSVLRSLKALEDAQDAFAKQIDMYLQKGRYDPDTEYETIETIIETCPEFLATKNETEGRIPLQSRKTENEAIFAPLMVRVGLQYGVGGDDARGGILVEQNNGFNYLQLLTFQKEDIEILNALKAMDPSMFYKADVCDHYLLQEAVKDSCLEMVEYLVEMDPSAIFESDEVNCAIPLAYCYNPKKQSNESGDEYFARKQKKLDIFEYLLRKSMSYRPDDETLGGLFAISNKKRNEEEEFKSTQTIFELLSSKYGADEIWKVIQKALSTFQGIPIHHKVIKHAPQQWSHACTFFPLSGLVRDDQGRLPVHIALETGNMQWSQEVVLLIMSCKSNLNELDPVTGWPPLALAASGNCCDLSTIFFLLQMCPEQVEPYCKKSRKRKR